ncbi:DUF6056 family protein [Pontibacter anaerobius]|uniref:DUF6056 family protein n=1 Tax=Pontibacter anaerobius TaxID=2993940 RepID=A0ABT3RFQ1_9BACT|nr:DUF6056 family protein [Pontibacter anaerobius]MCX2740244.1 DUF6056 family protein [Pontibacter anaerobius]
MSIQPSQNHRAFYFTLILLGIYCLLPFLLLSFYAYPQADDYPFALRDRQTDFWNTQVILYQHWSGRFFGTAILRLNPLITHSFSTYPYYALGMLLALAASLTFLLNRVLRHHVAMPVILGLSSLLLALYLVQLPSTAEGLFWLTGFLTYTVPNVLFLLLLFFLFSVTKAHKQSIKIVFTVVAAITGALIAGANEMAMLYLMASLLFILVVSWMGKSDNKVYFLAVFLFCFTVSLAVVLAPGNYARMASHPQAGQPLWSVVYASALTVASFYQWGALLLLASLVYVLLFGREIKDAFSLSGMFRVPLPLLLLYVVGTVFLMNFLFVWATGERPTPRLQNVIYFFLLLAWFYSLQVFINQKPHWFNSAKWPHFVSAAVSILLLLAFLNLYNNISTAYLDLLSGKAKRYNAELRQRDQQMANSPCQNCVVQPLTTVPASLYFLNLQEEVDEDNKWVNQDYARYWGKSSVKLSQPNPPVQDNYSTLVEVGKRWREQLFR